MEKILVLGLLFLIAALIVTVGALAFWQYRKVRDLQREIHYLKRKMRAQKAQSEEQKSSRKDEAEKSETILLRQEKSNLGTFYPRISAKAIDRVISEIVEAKPSHSPSSTRQRSASKQTSFNSVDGSVETPKTTTVHHLQNSPEDVTRIELNEDFARTLSLLENSSESIFVTGKAGTGKSTLLRYFVSRTNKKVVVLAFTGVAALNVGGETIHSFFKFPARPLTDDDIEESPDKEIYKAVDTIIIDEISMVRSDLLDAIDKFLQINGRYPQKPFGGTQMVFFGDLFQLPPIVSGKDEQKFFATVYRSPWFFDAHVFQQYKYKIIELTKVYRQRDNDFIDLLDAIRTGRFSNVHLERINQRVQPVLPEGDIITLTSTNGIARQINSAKLDALSGRERMYYADIEGDFPEKAYPTDTVLRLKEGAQVMFVKNDPDRRWVNGTIGKVVRLRDSSIKVEVIEEKSRFTYCIINPDFWDCSTTVVQGAEKPCIPFQPFPLP